MRLVYTMAVVFMTLAYSLPEAASVGYIESQSFNPDWQITENNVAYTMPSENRGGLKTWSAALPSSCEKKFSVKGDFGWTRFDRLTFRISLPENEDTSDEKSYELIAYFKDVDFWWYQKLLPYVLRPGDADEIVVPFDVNSDIFNDKYRWEPKDHMKPFNKSCLRKVREFGIIIFPSTRPEHNTPHNPAVGGFEVSNFRLISQKEPKKISIYDLAAPLSGSQYECCEISFRLNKTYDNPFNPDEIDISAEFTSPTGKKQTVYGFWYQDYRRTPNDRLEKLHPVGDPMWKLRFAPVETGEHTYRITIRDREDTLVTVPYKITVRQSKSDGFIRVSKKDYRYFEFDNGRFYWPVTLNLHCTYDYRYVKMIRDDEIPLEDRRTYFYDDRFNKMAAAGMNGTEIWIASWGFELEWRGDWIGWAGLGHYNLQNAWRLDHVLNRAEDLGIYINLVMSCHGSYSFGKNNTMGDAEWQNSPFYDANGGWLKVDEIKNMFTDELVFDFIKKKVRYIVARYAHSPSIWCWEIISESDLVPWKISDTQRQFIWKYAQYIKDIDPYHHPVTNHYCGSYKNYDEIMFTNPLMDFASGDAYRGGVNGQNVVHYPSFPKHIVAAAAHLAKFKKPVVANECGGTWSAGPLCLLEADIHALNWATFMTHLGGTPQTWWEDLVDENYWYDHYAAFAKYREGEDKRGRNLKTHDENMLDTDDRPVPELYALSLRNDKLAYVWVYDNREFSYGPTKLADRKKVYHQVFDLPKLKPTRTVSGAVCSIPGLAPGKYAVEIWDTYDGKIIDIREMVISGEKLSIILPDFQKDIALKIKNVLY